MEEEVRDDTHTKPFYNFPTPIFLDSLIGFRTNHNLRNHGDEEDEDEKGHEVRHEAQKGRPR